MNKKKILIVDDDRDLLQALSLRFRAFNYDVAFATDAASAIGVVRKERPDLILLDIGLPGGDGFTVMDRLKSLNATAPIPIIILTATAPSVNRERAFKAGAEAFMQKPVDNKELLAAIQKVLGQPEANFRGKPVSEKSPPVGTSSETRKKILVVDDDKDLLQALNLRLRASGYEVVFATDATQATVMVRKERPDVILLDIGLPGGDGFMVMDRLKSINAAAPIPIIILTATDPAVNRERAMRSGAEAFLQKPADNNELLAAIRKVLGEAPMKSPHRNIIFKNSRTL